MKVPMVFLSATWHTRDGSSIDARTSSATQTIHASYQSLRENQLVLQKMVKINEHCSVYLMHNCERSGVIHVCKYTQQSAGCMSRQTWRVTILYYSISCAAPNMRVLLLHSGKRSSFSPIFDYVTRSRPLHLQYVWKGPSEGRNLHQAAAL